MNIRNKKICAAPMIPNTTNDFFYSDYRYSIVFSTRNAIEFIIPYIISSQCSQDQGIMQSKNTRMKQPKEYP